MAKGLIWQDEENIIDVVYQTVYGLPVKEALHVVNLYANKRLIPVEWIEKWFSQFYGEQGLEWNRCKRFMLEDWEKENENNNTCL